MQRPIQSAAEQVPPDTHLEQVGELGVAVGHKFLPLGQRVEHIAQGPQAAYMDHTWQSKRGP